MVIHGGEESCESPESIPGGSEFRLEQAPGSLSSRRREIGKKGKGQPCPKGFGLSNKEDGVSLQMNWTSLWEGKLELCLEMLR